MHYLFLKYNNYYNRIVKKQNSITNYIAHADESTNLTDNFNFQEGDLVDTSLTVNWSENWIPDYLICYEGTDEIKHRWFIVESVRLRKGQYQMTLRRDVVVDNYDSVIDAPMFIEKATLPENNDLIFNSENMSYSQIKKSETPLYDWSKMAWIVGYLSNKRSSAISGQVVLQDKTYPTIDANHTDWYSEYHSTGTFRVYDTNKFSYRTLVSYDEGNYVDYIVINKGKRPTIVSWGGGILNNCIRFVDTTELTDVSNDWWNWTTLHQATISKLNAHSISEWRDLNAYNGKTYQFNDGIYKIRLVEDEAEEPYFESVDASDSVGGNLRAGFANHAQLGRDSGKPFRIQVTLETYHIEFTKIADATSLTYSIPASTATLDDAPYTMFCIPYPVNNETAYYIDNRTTYSEIQLLPNIAMSWAISIAKEANANLYDIQILPYCPLGPEDGLYLADYESSAGRTKFLHNSSFGTLDTDYIYLKYGEANRYICFFPRVSTFHRQLTNIGGSDINIQVKNYKIESECDMYRICSPNYSGVFEINAAKNGGLSYFESDCTYKPYNPFICVHPKFGRLYGKSFEDNRGLICGGDFSLPIITDQFKSYELTNKNYQAIFDRQIQNMEVNNSIQLEQAKWQAGAGTVQATVSGAVAGGVVGGIGGAVAGGLVSGMTSAAAGIKDVENTRKLQYEALDYTRDLYGYQLGNIKALPYSLAKTSSLNINSKYFPFIEYYTCTEQEKEALINKLKYNGMTVMTIGKMSDFITPQEQRYIKGKLIRLEDSDNDFHEVNAIAKELNEGVFI